MNAVLLTSHVAELLGKLPRPTRLSVRNALDRLERVGLADARQLHDIQDHRAYLVPAGPDRDLTVVERDGDFLVLSLLER
ncbi:MAG: hypothetical protein H0V89_03855 [Deltaproteobacteria bacterium]|nr:hypothetical protein [Deltaproteobacteria bacterium]